MVVGFSLGAIHLLHVIDGTFSFEHPETGRRRLVADDCIIITPATHYHVCVETGEPAPIHYAHLDITFLNALHLCDIAELPPLLRSAQGRQLGETIAHAEAALNDEAHLLSAIGHVATAKTQLAEALLSCARLTPAGEAMLAGAIQLAPALRFMHDHLESPVELADLAASALLSVSRFSAIFKRASTPHPCALSCN